MFTGIIKGTGTIKIVTKTKTDMRLEVNSPCLKNEKINIGDSIAINGTCLTVVQQVDNNIYFDLMNETLLRTTFNDLQNGDEVNVETSLTLNDKLDGHIVYGDVDSVGEITSINAIGDSKIYKIKYPHDFAKYIISKGRVTIDGASLTIVDVDDSDSTFTISLIPHSLKILNISSKKINDKVNIEYDVYAKLVHRQLRLKND